MILRHFKIFRRQLDNLIYLLVVSVGITYLFPNFFLMLQNKWCIPVFKSDILSVLGIVIIDIGLFLLVWCIAVSFVYKKGSLLSFVASRNFVAKGPYRIILHPVPLAMHFILFGEILFLQSPFLLVWFIIWARFSHLYVVYYKEPFLIAIHGKKYIDYWKQTPRWLPGIWCL